MTDLSDHAGRTRNARAGEPFLGTLSALALFGLSAAILAGFFGTASRALDSLSHFRAHLSAAAAFLALAVLVLGLRRPGFAQARLPAAIALTVAILGAWSVAPFVLPMRAAGGDLPDRPVYSLLHMNLLYDAAETQPALDRIRALRPDVVTLAEVEGEWPAQLKTLRDEYPYQFHCALPGPLGLRVIGGDSILSRHPFADTDAEAVCRPNDGIALRRVDLDGVAVSVAAQHLKWPWPRDQWYQIRSLAALWPSVPRPLLVGGDFNAAPWSGAVQTYAHDSATQPVAGIGSSWAFIWLPDLVRRYLGLPIDNVLASPEIGIVSVEKPEATASDHLPVFVRFMLSTPPPGHTDQQSVEAR